MNDGDCEMEDWHKEQEVQDEVTPANPIESESLEYDTEHTSVESTAREITMPLSYKAPVWRHFGF